MTQCPEGKIPMPSKVNKLLSVLAGVMLVGVVGAWPLWAQDLGPVSPQPLDGWATLKFGMTPRQACKAMNKAGLKCTEKHLIHTDESRVRIGDTTWTVDDLSFANQYSFDTHTYNVKGDARSLNGGNLMSIRLKLCAADDCEGITQRCDPESIIGRLEQQYGTFWRDPANSHHAVKRFANGAKISFYPCTVTYLNPNIEKPQKPPPPTPSGHF